MFIFPNSVKSETSVYPEVRMIISIEPFQENMDVFLPKF